MRFEALDLTDKVVVITGAGSGIGRACARLYARHGAHVVLAGRKSEPLEETASAVRASGAQALTLPTDVRDAEACERLISDTLDRFSRVDILVNNAGGSRTKDIDSWTLADFNDMLVLNLTSVWTLSLAAARAMRSQGGGAIVNVSSMASFRPFPHSAPYGAAKAGVNNLTATLSVDLACHGIRVNAVAPGTVKSEGFLRAMDKLALDPDDNGSSLTGRSAAPEELAWPILFLSSPAASFITGQTLAVSGAPLGWAPAERKA
jgi:NAD(P)-dependent dehydrogenase (short-subunit alcohol dehydrogenase family)